MICYHQILEEACRNIHKNLDGVRVSLEHIELRDCYFLVKTYGGWDIAFLLANAPYDLPTLRKILNHEDPNS